jgi:glutamate racemase
MKRNDPIGVFDTGVGGLSVVREMFRALPRERVVYFADRARQPYGALPHHVTEGLVLESLQFLLDQGAKVIVIACNTASAAGYEAARERFPVPVLSVIGPGIAAACRASRNKRIGLIGTKGTVESGFHARLLAAIDPAIQLFGQSCPLLPPLIELGKVESDDTRLAVEAYLKPLQEQNIDTLVLGCTHFPFIRKMIGEILGEGVAIIDPNRDLVRELEQILIAQEGLAEESAAGGHRFIVSRFPDVFREVGSMLLGGAIGHVEETLVGKPVEGWDIPEKDMYDPDKEQDIQSFLKP